MAYVMGNSRAHGQDIGIILTQFCINMNVIFSLGVKIFVPIFSAFFLYSFSSWTGTVYYFCVLSIYCE